MAPVFQTGVTLGDILDVCRNGFVCESDIPALNDLLSTGGLMNMSSSILMTVIAMMFGGSMEGSGQLAVIIDAIVKHIKGDAGIVGATVATCILSNIVMPEQYISILVPGRMYAPAYRERGIHPKSLSNALESAGTVTSCLVPWNTCGMFIKNTLGVSTMTYAPWAVFNYTMPIICLIMAFMGITVTKMTPEEQAKADAGELV
jgi:NhaC family Na+:H+ antiporter